MGRTKGLTSDIATFPIPINLALPLEVYFLFQFSFQSKSYVHIHILSIISDKSQDSGCPPSQTTKRRPSSRRTPASLPPRRRPRCRPNVLLTRRRSLVDGELGPDLCPQARSCGCSIEFVKPIFHGLKYPYPGTKTYFKTPSSSGICKPPRALLILCTYNMIMI